MIGFLTKSSLKASVSSVLFKWEYSGDGSIRDLNSGANISLAQINSWENSGDNIYK